MWLIAVALAAPVLTPPLAGVEDVDWTYAFGFDHAPADGELRDWRGQRRTYDNHEGIDFAIHGYPAMVAGVPVIAPCDGVVLGVRDDHRDHRSVEPMGKFPTGQDCGNGVGIDAGDGYLVQVCHLLEGSIVVRAGDRITRGQTLALVGWTGASEYPHVHLGVAKDGAEVDPMKLPDGSSLWSPQAMPALRPGKILTAGWYPQPPDKLDYQLLPDGAQRIHAASGSAIAAVSMVDVAAGDVILFDLTRPDGKRLVRELTLDKPWATYRQSFGNDRTGPRLLAGAWIARITVFRGEKVLDEVTIATEVTAGR
jgi:hypothetical protein